MKRHTLAYRLTVLVIAALVLGPGNALLSGVPVASALTPPDISGSYLADQGSGDYYAMYYIQQLTSSTYWAGLSMDPSLALDQQFHRGVDFTNVFEGSPPTYDQTLGAWTITGPWVNMTRGNPLNSGTVTVKVDLAGDGSVAGLETVSQTGGFSATHFSPETFGDTPDMYTRFDKVQKGSDPGSLHDNGLKPYRDETVFFGRVTSNSADDPSKDEVPHFDDGDVPTSYQDFICDSSEDHDLDFNVGVDQNRFETGLGQDGWGTRDPQDVLQKLYDSTAQGPARLYSYESFIHAEAIMYGHTATCDQAKAGDTGTPLFPGWGDTGSNSLLVNGQPVNGNMTQLYGYDVNTQSSYKEGVKFNNVSMLPGDQIRLTGSLILDCGHDDTEFPTTSDNDVGRSCDIGDVYGDNDQDEQMQEIHPIYSIDVIHHDAAHTNLTGTWGASDGSTYYIRQMGNTIWMFGLYRDRQALVPSGDSAPMPSYATVFKGSLDGPSIFGDAETLPYPGSNGGFGYSLLFHVNSPTDLAVARCNITICLSPVLNPPDHLYKLYEPPDSTPPQSTLTIGSPQYAAAGGTEPFVSSYTPFTVTATDADSGAQNIWYRAYPQGSTPPTFTPIMGPSGTFHINGTNDGVYQVDTFATDNAGNDSPVHSQLVYLDNTWPNITITQPTATTYTHNSSLPIAYTVDDGAGSGVQSVTATIDNQTSVGGVALQSGQNVIQSISLLTSGLSVGTPHTFKVNAVDNVGNTNFLTRSFTIIVTAQSIMDDVNQFVAAGAITQNEGTSLLSKLNSAAKARAAGDCANATTIYLSFISEVQAQTDKKITPAAAAVLIEDAQYLIAHCP